MAKELNISQARSLISTATNMIEQDAAKRGNFNHSCARLIGESAKLLERNDLVERIERLLRILTPESYWAGVITNISLPDTLPDSVFKIADRASILEWHPPYNDAYIDKLRIREQGEHVQLCVAHEFDAGFASAQSELGKTEVALTAAILGEFEAAESLVPKLPKSHRRNHVHLVLAIEYYRRDRVADAERMTNQIGSTIGIWDMCHLAIGITSYVPWLGYPYPDY